jgi:WD40 repeat protein
MLEGRLRSAAGVAVAGLACLVGGCGSRLATTSSDPAGHDRSGDPSFGDGGSAAAGGAGQMVTTPDADARSIGGGPVDAGTPLNVGDAGLALPPPDTCPGGTGAAAPAAFATVHTCGGQIALPSVLTATRATPAPHFFRCGAVGPEVETDLRLSPDGARLATLTGAGTIRLFATDDWHQVAQLAPLSGRVDAFEFSPDGTRLATLSTEPGELTVWNAADGTPQKTFTGTPTAGSGPSKKAALAFSRDGRRIASSLGTIVSVGDRGAVMFASRPDAFIDQMAFTMCDGMLYVRVGYRIGDSNWTTEVSLYDTQTGQQGVLFNEWDSLFGGSALSADGRLLAVSSADHPDETNDLSIYRGDTGELVDYRALWRPGRIQAFTPDDTALLVANNGQLDEWRVADGTVVTSYGFGAGSRLLGFPGPDAITISSPTETSSWRLSQKFSLINAMRFSATAASWTADGATGAAVSSDGALFHVWRQADATELCTPAVPGPTSPATSFALSGDGVVDLFDSASGSRRSQLETLQAPVAAVALSWDGSKVAAQTSAVDAPVQVWSASGTLITAVPPPGDAATMFSRTPFAMSPDGRTLLMGNGSTTDALIDTATGAAHPVQGTGQWPVGAPFSADSLHLTGWAGGALATWRVADGVRDDILVTPPDILPQKGEQWPDLAFASDWSVAAALNGSALVLWDPSTGREIGTFPGFASGFGGSVLGMGGATVAVDQYLAHTFEAEWYVARLYDVPTGVELRAFPAYGGHRPLLVGADGTRAYTLEPPDVITWCR